MERSIQVQDFLFLGGGDPVSVIFPGPHQHFQVIEVLMDVGDVEEGGLFQTDVHESRLHPGKNPDDPAFVNVPADPLLGASFYVELDQDLAFQQSNTGFPRIHVDQDFVGHGSEFLESNLDFMDRELAGLSPSAHPKIKPRASSGLRVPSGPERIPSSTRALIDQREGFNKFL